MRKEHSIPLNAIGEVDGGEIYLNARRDRLEERESDATFIDDDDDRRFDGTRSAP